MVVVAGVLAGASLAQADSVQYQSYGRASQSEACTAQVGETPWQASWGTDPSWKPSWEQWANNGTGGWTCGRNITSARTPGTSGGSGSGGSGSGGSGSATSALGSTGPGGGLVFLISGGLTYEMAPNTWGVNETTGIAWCSDTSSNITGAVGTAIGTGSANTTAMLTNAGAFIACTSSAPNAVRAYGGGGFSDWFLPSKDELNAMCNYSRNPSSPELPSEPCSGTQTPAFSLTDYAFASDGYWSSSQGDRCDSVDPFACTLGAWIQGLNDGAQFVDLKNATARVRPIRAF